MAQAISAEFASKAEWGAFEGKGYCWIETGFGKAAFGSLDFYASPAPEVKLRSPSRPLRWGKIFFEKQWFRRWF
ncbi:MAG: hypothetical protein A3K66_01145 [Euryarchaeota archaeon RBG_16_67_27]|nr:MAG: hypothetical protein A3K66_01145 [Euryarchaeota archaeon RBG_16_67_27]